jgi:hypothetical protein
VGFTVAIVGPFRQETLGQSLPTTPPSKRPKRISRYEDDPDRLSVVQPHQTNAAVYVVALADGRLQVDCHKRTSPAREEVATRVAQRGRRSRRTLRETAAARLKRSCGPRGDRIRQPASSPATERSSSMASQWMPTPPPTSRQPARSSGDAARSRGNHSNGVAISRPSESPTRISAPSNATPVARGAWPISLVL